MHPAPRFVLLLPALLVLAFVGGIGSPRVASAATTRVIVDARGIDRRSAVASLEMPPNSGTWYLRDEQDHRLPVQFHEGRAWFIEPGLAADATRTYELVHSPGAQTLSGSVGVRSASTDASPGDLVFSSDQRPVFHYLAHEGRLPRPDIPTIYRRGGYLHPVRTPSGRVITDDYPANHIHHHGFWWAWTKTEFEGRTPDFWNMGEGKGRVDFVRLDEKMAGPVFAGSTSRHVFTDLLTDPGKPALHEIWRVRLYATAATLGVDLIDLDSEQNCATSSKLNLTKYLYGGLGFRGPGNWNEATNALYLDSNGVTNRLDANYSRVRWYWMGGQVDGQLAGVAVLGHSSNFRAPQPVRVHPTEPFICWSPSQLGDWTIKPGETYSSRYRIVPLDGPPDARFIDRLWQDFATPVGVRVLR